MAASGVRSSCESIRHKFFGFARGAPDRSSRRTASKARPDAVASGVACTSKQRPEAGRICSRCLVDSPVLAARCSTLNKPGSRRLRAEEHPGRHAPETHQARERIAATPRGDRHQSANPLAYAGKNGSRLADSMLSFVYRFSSRAAITCSDCSRAPSSSSRAGDGPRPRGSAPAQSSGTVSTCRTCPAESGDAL